MTREEVINLELIRIHDSLRHFTKLTDCSNIVYDLRIQYEKLVTSLLENKND